MKRMYLTYLGILVIGAMVSECFSAFWLRCLVGAPFVLLAVWLVSSRRHSDFAWWAVLHPKESHKMLLLMAFMEYMKWKLRIRIWKSKRASKKK